MNQPEPIHERADIAFLRRRLAENISTFKSRRLHNRSMAFRLKMVVVALGVAATILLGLKQYAAAYTGESFGAIALVLTAAVPIFATWDAFFDYRWLWVRYTAVLDTLYAVSDDLEFAIVQQNEPTIADVKVLFERMQGGLLEANKQWEQKRVQAQEKAATSSG
ncbi:MAG: SLATT domain-containing protein [Bradyrhizobium sp.]|nr:SLATT domain-containing protein [Bradyrhizobium sp.]